MDSLRKTARKRIHIRTSLSRELMAEFLGTAFLVTVGCGSVAQFVIGKSERNAWIGLSLAWGFAVTFGASIAGNVSGTRVFIIYEFVTIVVFTIGGHLNPAISIMMYVLGNLTLVKTFLYSLAQTLGAFIGAAVVYYTYYDAISHFDGGARAVAGTTATAGIFATYPAAYMSVFGAVLNEIVGTAILGLTVCTISDKRNKIPGYLGPLLAGMVVTAIILSFGMNCGAALNPARDFGPRLFTFVVGYGWEVFSYNNYSHYWVPLLGPIIGALLGAWIYKLFVGLHWPQEKIIQMALLKNKDGSFEEQSTLAR